jgi:hypothetical protein
MRLDILGLMAVLVATVAADAMVSYTMCLAGPCHSQRAIWYTAYGSFGVDAREGCRDTNVPAMWQLCVDWGNSRGHFMFDGQPKRCIRKQASRGMSLPSARNKKKNRGRIT